MTDMIDWTKPLEVFENGEWVAAIFEPEWDSPDEAGDYYLVKKDGGTFEYTTYTPSGERWIAGTGSGVVVRNRPAPEAKFTIPADYDLRYQAMDFSVRTGGSLIAAEILKFLKGEG